MRSSEFEVEEAIKGFRRRGSLQEVEEAPTRLQEGSKVSRRGRGYLCRAARRPPSLGGHGGWADLWEGRRDLPDPQEARR